MLLDFRNLLPPGAYCSDFECLKLPFVSRSKGSGGGIASARTLLQMSNSELYELNVTPCVQHAQRSSWALGYLTLCAGYLAMGVFDMRLHRRRLIFHSCGALSGVSAHFAANLASAPHREIFKLEDQSIREIP